jgi:hypothetical protein
VALERRQQNEGVKKALRMANQEEGGIRPHQPLLVEDTDFAEGEGKP